MSFRNNGKNSYPALEVHVTRGNLTESVHLVDAVLVDESGQTVADFGLGGKALTYPRSAIKMLQAVSFVESGAYEAYGLSEKHLSLSCASHNGEPAHTELVMNWLGQLQFSEDDMVCGPHFPYDETTSRDLIRQGELPKKRHNNCSGKHTSMLSTLKYLGWDHRGYEAYDHDFQVRLRSLLSELMGEEMHKAPWGIDGCGIPTYGTTLAGMARGLRHMIHADHMHAERKEALRIIRKAVLEYPYYVGGTGDFCSDAMKLSQGHLVLKAGAEGVYAGALLDQGLALALKVRDGNPRAARVATGALLLACKALSEEQFLKLSSHTEPPVKNWAGLTVGKIFVPNAPMG